ncbi:MAG TPA: hypothetical protein VFM89_06740 [Casimicrobiaceae bacterium]|nr:hypothetical protein [Casimicrobiaceae bacterium]
MFGAAHREVRECGNVLRQPQMRRRPVASLIADQVITARDIPSGSLDEDARHDAFVRPVRLGFAARDEARHIVRCERARRHVCLPMHDRVRPGRDVGKDTVELASRSDFQEFVGVDGKDEVGTLLREELTRESRHALGLEKCGRQIAEDREGQSFGAKRLKDLVRTVDRGVFDRDETVENRQVVPNEGFDDVGLVAQHGNADQPHPMHRELDQAAATRAARDRES